jgi:hypothetical protein
MITGNNYASQALTGRPVSWMDELFIIISSIYTYKSQELKQIYFVRTKGQSNTTQSPNIVYRANNVLVDAQLSIQYFRIQPWSVVISLTTSFYTALQNDDNSVSDSTQLDIKTCKQFMSHCTFGSQSITHF